MVVQVRLQMHKLEQDQQEQEQKEEQDGVLRKATIKTALARLGWQVFVQAGNGWSTLRLKSNSSQSENASAGRRTGWRGQSLASLRPVSHTSDPMDEITGVDPWRTWQAKKWRRCWNSIKFGAGGSHSSTSWSIFERRRCHRHRIKPWK